MDFLKKNTGLKINFSINKIKMIFFIFIDIKLFLKNVVLFI